MSFSPIGSTVYQPYSQNQNVYWNDMLAKAKAFSEKVEVVEYIEHILNSSEFRSNPKQFIENWNKRRGDTEEYRFPEDRARGFFVQNFNL